MYNEQASPTVLGCTFASNQLLGCAGWLNGGAGMYNDQSSPILRDCRFLDNQGNNGGGIMNVNLSHPIIDRCVFDSNHATYSGGGLNNTEDSGATVVNCLFRANSAFHGAGMYTTGSVIEVTNCTVVANVATSTGGGIYLMYAPTSCAIANSIFRSNVATANPAGKEIDRYLGAISTVNNCNVEGGWSGPGWSNIDADPLFVDAGAGDLHLEPGSPSVDSGLNLSLPQGIDSDLDGLTRVVNTTVDMGSYEQQGTGPGCPRDLSGDGTVDVDDLIALFAAWGSCPSCTGPCPPDLNGDCLVNVIDLVDLMDGWGTCP
jgi:parallel beta-helix repeat protein